MIEYTGLKAESEKRGLGSPIEEKTAEGSKAHTINNNDNEVEMNFRK